MTEESKSTTKKTRRGLKLYQENPFIAGAAVNTKQGVKKITDKSGTRMMVVNGDTGEIKGPAGFWHQQEVDKTQFVKLYVNGVKAFKDLTSAGTKVFEVLYIEIQKQVGKDRVYISFGELDQELTPMSETTYARGMRELVAKEFLAPCTAQGWFYINPDYLWNGDRLAFVKEFRRAVSPKPIDSKDTKTMDMFDQTKPEPD